MKQEVKVIRDIDLIKLCVEDTRSKILSLLRVRDMSISQLAEALDKDQSTIYRHLKKLEKVGYVEVSGERKVHHIPEKMYGRTATIFIFSPSDGPLGKEDTINSWEIQHNFNAERIIKSMTALGYDIEVSEEHIENLSSFFFKLDEMTDEVIERSQDKLSNINHPTFLRLKLLIFILEIMGNETRYEEAKNILDMFCK
ncbi:MAG: ArsR family transcriptional regulator [Thermoplasmata archaeon]